MDRQLYGNTHPSLADVLVNLGQIQHSLGNDASAENYYRQALVIKRAWYGDNHPETAMAMSAVGQALVYQGRYDEAATILQQDLSIQEHFFGKVHAQVAVVLNMLAKLDLRRKHLKDAEAEYVRMAAINHAIHGDNSYLTGIAAFGLESVYEQQGNYARAENSGRVAVKSFLETLPPGHQYTSFARLELGHVLVLERKYAEAEPNLVAGYQDLIKSPNPPANRLVTARADLSSVNDVLHKPEDAKVISAK
jgi:serine/threonine-protein kinase